MDSGGVATVLARVGALTLASTVALCARALDAAPPAGETPRDPPPRAAAAELPEVTIVGSSPVSGTGIPLNLYPGNAQTLSGRRMPAGTQSISSALNAAIGSVNLNDTQGSTYQVDVNYRGYTASPILGTPQGLSVYVDGMRMNEPFGGVVSWDLVPVIAVASTTVIPGANPVYGLNTLGGALAIDTKSGFAFPETSVRVGTGSYGRRAIDAQAGGYRGHTDYYLAASFGDDPGWARGSGAIVEDFFCKLGFQDSGTDANLTLQHVADRLGAAQLVARSMLGNAAQGYSHPDTTQTRSDALNLAFKRDFFVQYSPAPDRLEGNLYYRNIWRDIGNSNIADPVTPGIPGQLAACRALYGSACASNVASVYTQNIYGINGQFSTQRPLAGLPQFFSLGFNDEYGSTGFAQSTQDAVLNTLLDTVDVGTPVPQSRIGSDSLSVGLYGTDTVQLGRTSLTLSLRFNRSRMGLTGASQDVFGERVRVDGNHAYQHLNASAGGTFALATATTLFGNFSDSYRTPSAIELACGDPAHPCAGVPSAFSADPALHGVIARSLEAGMRRTLTDGTNWRLALFRSELTNDILFHQSTLSTGYFSNVGATRRQGLETALEGQHRALEYAASVTLLDASYRSSFYVANGANAGSACPGSACVPVISGDRIPGLPRVEGKLVVGYQARERTRLDLQLQAQGPSFARGDENNLATSGRIPGFLTAQGSCDLRVTPTLDLNLAVTNLFDRRYASFGILAANNLRGGEPENFWAVAQPRALFLSVKAVL